MDNYCSPQWVDFTSTPDVPSDDYFEKNHEIYEYKKGDKIPEIEIISENEVTLNKVSETKVDDKKLKSELDIIKNTPIKVIYSPSTLRKSKKHEISKKLTYDDVLHETIETIEHCVSAKLDIFKKPMPITNDVSKTLKFNVVDDNQEDVLPNVLSNIDNPIVSATAESLNVNIPCKQEQDISSEKSSSSKRSKPLTYQCRRQSVTFRRRSNQFTSLAAAVHKFQNETPERFHTKCNRNLKVKTTSAKRYSSVSRKSILAKPNINRRSVPALIQLERKNLKSTEMKELPCDTTSQKQLVETPNTTKSRRSCLNISTKNKARNKHIVSTIIGNSSSEIVVKKEKVLFFDIPIHTTQKATTHPTPFSFEYRDKTKIESKSKQLEPENNKLVNNVKSQNIATKVTQKKVGMLSKNKNNEKNVATTNKNPKTVMKTTKSRSISSLKPCEKTEDKSKKNEDCRSKDTEQINKQSKSMSFKNSLNKREDVNEEKNTEHSTWTKNTTQTKKQPLLLCKEKSRSGTKKTETIETKEDPNKVKKESSTHNSINTNTDMHENKCPNVNASTNDKNLHQTKNIKPKGATIGMNSYQRGKQRHEFDEKVRQKIQMQEEMRKKMEAEKLNHEKLEIAMLRKQLEVRARPMPVYKPLLPIKSTKPLTQPHSPAWSHKPKTKKAT